MKTMRIGVDGQARSGGKRRGFSTYVGSLLDALRSRYPEHEFIEWSCEQGPNWRIPNQLWWDQAQVPWRAFREHVAVLHTPAFSGPIMRPCPLVLTVHDLLYRRYPEWLSTRRAQWYWGRWIPFTARWASAVIAPSQATKTDLVSLAGVDPERVHVIPEAVDAHFLKRQTSAEIQSYRIRKGLISPYILYVGIIDRRKDLGSLLRAYALIRANQKDVRLVIAGHVIPGRSDLPGDIRALGLDDDVVLPGYIPDEELPLLYAGASLFVYPSRWEGFGLPPLEAMALGVPVITYRVSSLPEVVGNAAVLIDPPFAEEALASAIVRVLEDMPFRAVLIERGVRRAAEFSWERAADQTMAVYRQCLEQAWSGKGKP